MMDMVRRLCRWLGALLTRWGTPAVDHADLVRAVYNAAAGVGVNPHLLTPQSDLACTGKIYEVLHLAAAGLKRNHELTTVQDVVDWLAEAPVKD